MGTEGQCLCYLFKGSAVWGKRGKERKVFFSCVWWVCAAVVSRSVCLVCPVGVHGTLRGQGCKLSLAAHITYRITAPLCYI